jgi:trimethylamine:corrinoid methyltransferase-like protein
MTTETGGQAFPSNTDLGMTLRDYFAGQAMQSLTTQYRAMYLDNTLEDWEEEAVPALAEESYLWADEMLKARAKPSHDERMQKYVEKMVAKLEKRNEHGSKE